MQRIESITTRDATSAPMSSWEGRRGSGTGAFCTFSEPLSYASFSLMKVETENGIQTIPMLGPDDRPTPWNVSDLGEESDDFVDGDKFFVAVKLPSHLQIGEETLGSEDALVLFGDGGWWPEDKRWGVGVVSRTTGHSWSCGGWTDGQQMISCGDNRIEAATIEAMAVREMLRIGYRRGYRIHQNRSKRSSSASDGLARTSLGKHLIIVTDRPALIGNVRRMTNGGRIRGPRATPSREKTAFLSMVESVVIAIADACTVFERVSIVHKDQFASEIEWSRHTWLPHKLACAGADVKQMPLTVEAAQRENFDLLIRSYRLENSCYKHATFSYDWDD